MKQVKRPQINGSSGKIRATWGLRNNGRAAGGKGHFAHAMLYHVAWPGARWLLWRRAISLRTGSGLGLIRRNFCSSQDLWNHAVYIRIRSAVIHDAGAQGKFPPNSRVRQIHTAALDQALKNR